MRAKIKDTQPHLKFSRGYDTQNRSQIELLFLGEIYDFGAKDRKVTQTIARQ